MGGAGSLRIFFLEEIQKNPLYIPEKNDKVKLFYYKKR